ncbi:MAG TPA: hypothetical protein DCX54_04325, partial [Flavobacteriales bacterium]|nr:hypothetical protein [Flavobacteriales bacterium]
RPGTIKMDMEVDLPRPRVDDVWYTPEFVKLARKLRKAIEQLYLNTLRIKYLSMLMMLRQRCRRKSVCHLYLRDA